MRKGEETRQTIIAKAAPLFNQQGYAGASMADIMAATGLQKGGLYNHFASKDELAVAAFAHNWEQMRALLVQALAAAGDSAMAQLATMVTRCCAKRCVPLLVNGNRSSTRSWKRDSNMVNCGLMSQPQWLPRPLSVR